jgi:hypothetical protein
VSHYEHIRALHPNIFVTFVAIEDLLNSDDPEGDFNVLFTQRDRKRIIMDDLEGFHSRKLGRLNVENSLVEKLVLTESLGIEVWEIFHSLKSSKLRPRLKSRQPSSRRIAHGGVTAFTVANTFCDCSTFSARYTTLRSSMLILLYLPALLGWLAVPLG